MHIDRTGYRPRASFRPRRRRPGCLGGIVLFTALLLLSFVGWSLFARVGRPLPTSEASPVLAAQAAFDQGDVDSAIAGLDLYRRAHPDDPAAVTLLARALVYRSYGEYNRAADRTAALDITRAAAEAAPSQPDILAIHAWALAINGQVVSAARTAEQVLQTLPDHTRARTARALAYGTAGNHDIALRESLRAIETAAPQEAPDVLRVLAMTYNNLANHSEALRAIDTAIGFNARLLVLHFERAYYALQLGDANIATVAYYQVLTFDASNIKARLRLCELSSTMRERAAALEYCTDVTRRAPAWADGWYQLGREYFLQGEFAQAQRAFGRCSTLQVMQNVPVGERRFECWYLQGQAAEILGDCIALRALYYEYRAMAASADRPETWTYPPEGPTCLAPTPQGR